MPVVRFFRKIVGIAGEMWGGRGKRYVRHGCVDCVYYELPLKTEPCKSCERHSNWADKREAAQEKTVT